MCEQIYLLGLTDYIKNVYILFYTENLVPFTNAVLKLINKTKFFELQ